MKVKTQPPVTKWKVKDEVLDNSSTFGDSIPEQITSGWGLQMQYVGMSCFLFVPMFFSPSKVFATCILTFLLS